MTALRICRKIFATGLVFSLLICAVLFAKEIFFDGENSAAGKCYCADDIENSTKKDFTKISFQNGEDGFDIELCRKDCFANFYRAKPGMVMTTKTEVNNLYETPVSVILKAASRNIKPADKEIALLSRYTDIKVCNEKGLTLYSGKVWNEKGEPRNISLGTYGADESRTLSVDIKISEDADKNTADVCRNIIWVFTGLNTETSVAAPETNLISSENFLIISIAITCVIVILSVIMAQLKKKLLHG